MSLQSFILSAHLAVSIIGLGGSTSAWGGDLDRLSITDLQRRLAEIDSELAGLAHMSLNSGVGPIGFRSRSHTEAEHLEWARVDLSREAVIDEIVLVPALWRDLNAGFVSDAFPSSLRILAGTAGDPTGSVVAEFRDTAHLLPRIAPLVVPIGRIRASWVRIETDRLSRRAFDGRYIFQLAEMLVFADQENLALRRPVSISQNDGDSPTWNPVFLVDGILPYVMNSGRGNPSLAFISEIGIGDRPSIEIDLQRKYPVSGIRLHAVDQSDTVPQAYPGDYALPHRFRIEGANDAGFTDAQLLMEASPTSIYELGSIMEWNFRGNDCRYLRLTALEPYFSKESGRHGTRIGYAEIEVLADGRNVAVGQPASAAFRPASSGRRFESLTDGHNLYGRILPVRQWLGELARRHDLETARPLVVAELSGKHTRTRTVLTWMFWLAALLAGAIAFILFYNHYRARRQETNIRERIAANLHDELGANLHAIGLLGYLAKDAVDSREDLVDTLDRIRSLTERTGFAARNCAHMVLAKGICEDLVEEMRRDSLRLLADLEHSITFEGEEILHRLSRRKRIDLYLFHKEALINIIRHSGATEATTRLVASPGEIVLTISDNGCGIAGGPPSSLKRRARLLGAALSVESPEAGGTRIVLKLKSRKFAILK
ncbi:MAG: ATP-binding protein [Verrucomicrobiota bacterium]